MLLGDVPRTGWDLNFSIGPIPVRIGPFFWLIGFIVVGNGTPLEILLGIAAVTVSILIHELGHSLAFAFYGIPSHIVLYQFGGLSIPENYQGFGRRHFGPFEQIVVSAAGPFAQIAFAYVVAIGLQLGQFDLSYIFGWPLPVAPFADKMIPEGAFAFLSPFFFVSLYWALLNLAPIFPLDGGQITRNVLVLLGRPNAIRESLVVSVATGALLAIWGLNQGSIFMPLLFGMLAYSSFQQLQGFSGGSRFGGRPW